MYIPEEVEKILFTREQLDERIKQLGEQLTRDYADKDPLFLCVLRGAVVFFSDLMRAVECPLTIDFIRTASYNGTESSGVVEVDLMNIGDISGRDVVIVEDICDSGRSLVEINKVLGDMEPKSLKTVCLLDKPSRRVVEFKPDYTGFVIDDLFVVGSGFDCDSRFRNLPYIGIYKTVARD